MIASTVRSAPAARAESRLLSTLRAEFRRPASRAFVVITVAIAQLAHLLLHHHSY